MPDSEMEDQVIYETKRKPTGFDPKPKLAGTHTVTTRWTEEEYKRLSGIAKARKMSLPEFAKLAIEYALDELAGS